MAFAQRAVGKRRRVARRARRWVRAGWAVREGAGRAVREGAGELWFFWGTTDWQRGMGTIETMANADGGTCA